MGTRSTSSSPTPSRRSGCCPTSSGPCRPLHPRLGYARRRARAIGRGVAERIPAVGPRFSVRPSDGTIEAAGVNVVHFPFQDAFTTEVPSIYQPHDLQHLHLPELFSPWIAEAAGDRLPHALRAGRGRGGDDLLGAPRLHPKLRPPRGAGLGRTGSLGPARVPGPERRGPGSDPGAVLAAGLLPLLSGAALAPQEPRAPARGPGAGPGADRDHDSPRLLRRPRRALPSGPGPRRRARLRGNDHLPGIRQPEGAPRPLRARDGPRLPEPVRGLGPARLRGVLRRAPRRLLLGDRPARPGRRRRPDLRPGERRADRRRACSGSGPTRACGATWRSAAWSATSSSAGTGPRACSAPTTAGSAGGALQRKTVSFWRLRLPPERRPFRDVDTGSSDKGAISVLQRALVGLLSALRRALGTINQVVFRDRLQHIDQQTERLGSASVEAVTHLGGEVRALETAARGDRARAHRPARAPGAPRGLRGRGRRARRGPSPRRLVPGPKRLISIRGPSGSTPAGPRASAMPSAASPAT